MHHDAQQLNVTFTNIRIEKAILELKRNKNNISY